MSIRPNRKDPPLSKSFVKDPNKEVFLGKLNETLAPIEEAGYDPNLKENLPTLQIIGPPRSGTTLLNQLVAAGLNVTCINNLTAAFWAAPVHGIMLSKHLGIRCPMTFHSRYGRTEDIGDPHEFGYFWSRMLGYEEMREPTKEEIEAVDWNRFRLVMLNMIRATERPIVFKAIALAWYMEKAVRTLPRTCFIRIERDSVQNAYSIFKGRKEYLSSFETWLSLRPKEYSWLKNEDVLTQVAGQVLFVNRALDRLLQRIPRENQLTLSYRELCDSPGTCLERIAALANRQGASVEIQSEPPAFDYREYDARQFPEINALKEKIEALKRRCL